MIDANKMTYTELLNDILNNDSISNVTKETIKKFDRLDCVDALQETKLIVFLMQKKCNVGRV